MEEQNATSLDIDADKAPLADAGIPVGSSAEVQTVTHVTAPEAQEKFASLLHAALRLHDGGARVQDVRRAVLDALCALDEEA